MSFLSLLVSYSFIDFLKGTLERDSEDCNGSKLLLIKSFNLEVVAEILGGEVTGRGVRRIGLSDKEVIPLWWRGDVRGVNFMSSPLCMCS